MEWIKDLSVIVASGVAIYGISAWRRQLIGGKRVELAEKLLASFYEARDIIISARSPASWSGEGKTRPRNESESEALSSSLDAYWAPAERLLKSREFFGALNSLQYRAIAYFGPQVSASFSVLQNNHNRVINASQMLVSYSRASGQPIPKDLFDEWTKIIWDHGRPDDAVKRDVDACIAAIEQICRPVLANADMGALSYWWTRAKSWGRSIKG